MERVRNVVCGLLLALGLLSCPLPALASDGFLGGLEDLTGTREVEVQDFEERYQEDYVPRLEDVRSDPVVEIDEDATTVEQVNATLDSFNRVQIDSANLSLLGYLQWITGALAGQPRNLIISIAGIVFMWWGVRKSVRVVMSSFRKGSASV